MRAEQAVFFVEVLLARDYLPSSNRGKFFHARIPLRRGTRNSSILSKGLPSDREVFAVGSNGRDLA